MSNWYYIKDNEPTGPFPEETFLQMFADGQIKRATKVWKEGMQEWTTLGASDLLPRTNSSFTAPQPEPELPSQFGAQFNGLPQVAIAATLTVPQEFSVRPNDKPIYRLPFNDLAGVTSTLNLLFYITAGLAALSMVSDAFQFRLIQKIVSGALVGSPLADAVQSNDGRQAFIQVIQLFLELGVAITLLYWVNQANKNVRALGAQRLQFTSGWAVGWWFVPIASLVRPFQIMTEIWKGSANPQGWEMEASDSRIGWWWGTFLLMNFLKGISRALGANPQNVGMIKASTVFSVLGNIVAIVCALLIAKIIENIWNNQRSHRFRSPKSTVSAAEPRNFVGA